MDQLPADVHNQIAIFGIKFLKHLLSCGATAPGCRLRMAGDGPALQFLLQHNLCL
jgi:hypothetical protein